MHTPGRGRSKVAAARGKPAGRPPRLKTIGPSAIVGAAGAMMNRIRTSAVLLLGAASLARADVLSVCQNGSGDFLLIEDAMVAAHDGDVIELCDGYHPDSDYRIEFLGKAVTLRSASGDPLSCRMGGRFYVHQGEGNDTRIEGISVRGGAIAMAPSLGLGGGVVCAGTSPVFSHCVFESLAVIRVGGALLVEGGHPVFENCIFRGNSAIDENNGGDGGAAWITGGASVDFIDCVFTGNHAEGDPLFYDPPGRGGAIRGELVGTITLRGCTLAGNYSDSGGAIHCSGSLVLERTIVWGNCASVRGDQIVLDGATASLECSLVDTTGVDGAGLIIGGGNLFVDPLFCEPSECTAAPTAGGVYELAENSPALSTPCGDIGAFGTGCEAITVNSTSWSRIKGRFSTGE